MSEQNDAIIACAACYGPVRSSDLIMIPDPKGGRYNSGVHRDRELCYRLREHITTAIRDEIRTKGLRKPGPLCFLCERA